jgi:hypothetical protein
VGGWGGLGGGWGGRAPTTQPQHPNPNLINIDPFVIKNIFYYNKSIYNF